MPPKKTIYILYDYDGDFMDYKESLDEVYEDYSEDDDVRMAVYELVDEGTIETSITHKFVSTKKKGK